MRAAPNFTFQVMTRSDDGLLGVAAREPLRRKIGDAACSKSNDSTGPSQP
ncbi:MAG: hypothetical protein IPG50_32795 [Myxococcales bacterium]|nr:hypothetical protein [Myxococcales bacterium]